MQRLFTHISAGLLVAATLACGQTAVNNGQSGWRRVGDPAPADQSAPVAQQDSPPPPMEQASPAQAPPSLPPAVQQGPQNYQGPGNPNQNYPNQNYPNSPYANMQNNRQPLAPPPEVPATLQVPAGTFLTVRTDGAISSDHSHPGDAFSATLAQPLVVNGVVIAEPGQTISGQVVEAQKAGRIEGTARLRVQLTELTLVDGQQLPIRTQFIGRKGPTSVGRDAGAIAGTTGLGAAVGAAADWGRGAAIGAGAGAAVGVLGVLLTRGQPSVIYPEETLTFRIEAPLTVDTQRSSQAFRYIQPNEYNQPLYTQPQQPRPAVGAVPPPYYAYPYPAYPYYGYPYYGPSVSFFVGHGYYGPGWYRGGYYGRGWRR